MKKKVMMFQVLTAKVVSLSLHGRNTKLQVNSYEIVVNTGGQTTMS